MMLGFLKHGGLWYILSEMFKIKWRIFENIILKFTETMGPDLVTFLVDDRLLEKIGSH